MTFLSARPGQFTQPVDSGKLVPGQTTLDPHSVCSLIPNYKRVKGDIQCSPAYYYYTLKKLLYLAGRSVVGKGKLVGLLLASAILGAEMG